MKKLLNFLGVVLTLALLLDCSIKEPATPEWTLPISLPLSPETFRIIDEMDSTLVDSLGADSLIFVSVGGELETITLSTSDLTVTPQQRTESVTLDTLTLSNLQPLESGFISLRALAPFLSGIPSGQTVTLPETTMTAPPPVLASPDFKFIHMFIGEVRVKIRNNLPFTIGPNSISNEAMHLSFYSEEFGTLMVEASITDSIPSGQTLDWVRLFENEDVLLYSPMRVEFDFSLSRSSSFTVSDSLLDSSGLAIVVEIENVRASEVIGKLEPQRYSDRFFFSIENSNRLREGEISRGDLQITFDSNIPIGTRLQFTIPLILNPFNQPLQDSVLVDADNSSIYTLDLAGFIITNGGNFVDSIYIDVEGVTQAADSFVQVLASDGLDVTALPDTFAFQRFSGFLGTDFKEFDPFEENNISDYSGIENGLQFQEATLSIRLFNEIDIENLFVDIDIQGFHVSENGDTLQRANLSFPANQVLPGSPGNATITILNFSGADMIDFLNILPTSLIGAGRVQYGGEANVTVNQSRIGAEYEVSTPLRIEIKDLSPIEGNITTIARDDIQEELRTAIDEQRVTQASLKLNLLNSTPLAGSVKVLFSADPSRTQEAFYDTSSINPDLEFLKFIQLQPGTVDPVTGFVTSPRSNTITFSLNNNEIQLFGNPPLRVGYLLTVADSDGRIALRSFDFVQVSGTLNFVAEVKD